MARTQTRVQKAKPDSGEFGEVRTVWTDEEANTLLKDGWILACSHIAHRGQGGFQAKPCFILKRPV